MGSIDSTGCCNAGHSGFIKFPDKKYLNLYSDINSIGIKGDAINADGTMGFYGRPSSFATGTLTWLRRGGDSQGKMHKEGMGVFNYNSSSAGIEKDNTTRFTLVSW